MSDKFKRTLPVDISFTAGEMPSATKLNALASGVKTALTTIEKFLGDGWDENYPYFSTSDTLASPTRSSLSTAIGSEKKLEIANLSRLIGPASALNPIHLSHVTGTEKSITETVSAGRTSFRLRYSPVDTTSLVWSDTAVFATRKSSSSTLASAGDYYVNASTGEVFTISETTAGTVIYDTANAYSAFASYPGASFNIIPDPNQSTKCSATGPVDGKYTITLPTITNQEADDLVATTAVGDDDLNFGVQLQLPEVLNHLVTGDTIPEGFLYLRDDNTNEVFRAGTYYYVSATQLKIGGVTLDTSHGFTVITVGTTITQAIQDLQYKVFKLRRGIDSAYAIKIDNVTGLVGPSANDSISGAEVYVPSEAPNNHLPQYLHRDGWFGSDYDNTNINDSNGMRGDLVMLGTSRSGGIRNSTLVDSVRIYFGDHTNGPYTYYESSSRQLVFRGPLSASGGLLIRDKMYVEDPLYAESGIATHASATEAGPFYFLKDELTFQGIGGYQTRSLSATAQTLLTGKKIISVNFVAKRSDVTIWRKPLLDGGAGITSYGYDAFFDESAFNVQISLENAGIWQIANTNMLRVHIVYTD